MDWGLIKALGPKAAVVYNPADPWFQHYHEMQEVLPGIEVRHTLHHLYGCLCMCFSQPGTDSTLGQWQNTSTASYTAEDDHDCS